MAYMAMLGPASMAFMQQDARMPWTSYMPASLQRRASPDAAAVRARSIKLARFRDKKQRFAGRRAVRYENRKRYADSRPRVSGRFVSKAQGATLERPGAV